MHLLGVHISKLCTRCPKYAHWVLLLSKITKYIDKRQAITIFKSTIMPYFDYGDIFLIRVQKKTQDMLQKLHNRALRLVLNRDSRHTVWELHDEASTPMLEMMRACHLKNLMHKRKDMPNYVIIPNRQLRIDKGSRCVLRYTFAFLITLMAFLVL